MVSTCSYRVLMCFGRRICTMFESVPILPVPLKKVDFLVSCQITLRGISFNRG